MFTGIVEEIGTLKNISHGERSMRLEISCVEILSDVRLGDSISVNGICLTVNKLGDNSFYADVMPETMRHTNLGSLTRGTKVNLERAMSIERRFGGHIVTGHIDGVGTIANISREDNAVWITIKAEREIMKYIIHKGSVALDGISLTVQQLGSSDFKVSIIPHTRDFTTLPGKKPGDIINIECDVIGKYIERLMTFGKEEKSKGGLTLEYLLKNGF